MGRQTNETSLVRENDRFTEAIVPPFGGEPFPVEASGLLIGGSGDVSSGFSISTVGHMKKKETIRENNVKIFN